MATFYKRKGKRGVRWTARVRVDGREVTKTWSTRGAAETWAKAQELAIEAGQYLATDPRQGAIFADLVDGFIAHRKVTKRQLGKTGSNVLVRLKEEHGLEPAATLNVGFWRRHVFRRMADGAASQTAVGDLAYAASILAHAKREGLIQDATGPAEARAQVAAEGLRTNSKSRERRISDDELASLVEACDKITSSVPLGAIVRFALATSMRRGEILRLQWADLNETDRVVLIRDRKHPRDRERVDECPLLPIHSIWPRWDALEIAKAQRRKTDRIFPYMDDTVGERFERACAAAKIDGVVFHLLRHESLSRYAERGFDPLRLQLIGGHRDLRHVVRYAKLTARGLAKEAAPAPADSGKAAERADSTRAPA